LIEERIQARLAGRDAGKALDAEAHPKGLAPRMIARGGTR
jgi:hypothetical protein